MHWGSNPLAILDGRCTIHIGDVIERLRDFPDESVDVVVSSPPYWLVRDYEADGQLGLEPTLSQHIANLIEVFAELRRVLKPHGSVWLNYGDSYAADVNGRNAKATKDRGNDDRSFRDKPASSVGNGPLSGDVLSRSFADVIDASKAKDLLLIPNILALALRAAGWWVRCEIVWGKSNPMPDSAGHGRPSTSYEKVLLLTKRADAEIYRARDTGQLSFDPDHTETVRFRGKKDPVTGELATGATRWILVGSYYNASAVLQPLAGSAHPRMAKGAAAPALGAKVATSRTGRRNNASQHAALASQPTRRLLRSFEEAPVTVWSVKARAYRGGHYATFPPELVAIAIEAGSPATGSVVLDPFGGTGTTALVAVRMGRQAHLIELKPEFAYMARQRLEQDWMGEEERRLAEGKVAAEALAASGELEPLPLFSEAAE